MQLCTAITRLLGNRFNSSKTTYSEKYCPSTVTHIRRPMSLRYSLPCTGKIKKTNNSSRTYGNGDILSVYFFRVCSRGRLLNCNSNCCEIYIINIFMISPVYGEEFRSICSVTKKSVIYSCYFFKGLFHV